MLKKTVLSMAVAAILGGVVETRIVQADDDMWDLMNPAWWIDKMDDDDDDDWRYWRHGYGPYGYGGPYGWGYPPPYAFQQPQKPSQKKQPEQPIPE